MHEKTLTSNVAFKGKLLSLEQLDVELADGSTSYREIVRHPGAVGVLARLPDGRFLFVRQYRKAVEACMLEVVAGLLDPGETPEAAAHRELAEETGYRAASLLLLGSVYASPGYVDEKVEIYLAQLEGSAGRTTFDHGEHLEAVSFTRDAFAAEVRAGRVHDAKTLAAWALFLEHERTPAS